MRVQYVCPFAEAAVSVFQAVVGVAAERGQLAARAQLFTTQQVNIICAISGDVEGLVIYGTSVHSALKIASKMIGSPATQFDMLVASALSELGNMITGHSAARLASEGFHCRIAPPTVLRGTNVNVSTAQIPTLTIPLILKDLGTFEVNVSLRERGELAA